MILLLAQKMSTRKMWIVVFFKQTYKFSLKNGDEVTEDVDISVKGNFVQYHVQDDDTEVTAIDDFNAVSSELISSSPIPLRLHTLPYWSNPPVLIFDIRALWRSVLSARAPECQKSKLVG